MRYKLAAAIAMLGIAGPAFADPWEFLLNNNTGKEITLIEVSPAGANQWQPNKVEADEKARNIKPATRATIHFDKSKDCKWQIRATYADKSTAVFPAVNVCDNSMLVIKYVNGAPAATGI